MKTIIIGGGAAGAACAIWLEQLGCPVILLEKNHQIGGLQTFSPYPNTWSPGFIGFTGQDIAKHLSDHVASLSIQVKLNTKVSLVEPSGASFRVFLEDGSIETGTQIVLATGTRFKTGGFPQGPNISFGPGVVFESMNLVGKSLAILGGGDNAFDAYQFGKKNGANKITIFARSLRAQKKLQALVPDTDVVVGPFEVNSSQGRVNGIPFDAISVQFGYEPVVPNGLETLERTAQGYVKADHWGCTSMLGVYAIGEVANTLHPCVTTSFAHGIQAAKHIQNTLGL